jgi:hypothetical protein
MDQLIIVSKEPWYVWAVIGLASIPISMIVYSLGKMGIKILSIIFSQNNKDGNKK